jgi:hypothetical protein
MRRRLLVALLLVAVALTPPTVPAQAAPASAYTLVIDRYTWWDGSTPVAYGIRIWGVRPPYPPYYANASTARDAELLVAGAQLVATALAIPHVVRGTYP